MAAFVPILYESEEVGRRIKSTKVKHSWMFEISGKSYTLDYYDSRRSHKAKVCLDGVEVFKGKKTGSDFTIPLRAGRSDIVVVQKKDQVDITIGNIFFKHEVDRAQRQSSQISEGDYQDDFGDIPDYVKPKAQPARPVDPPRPKPAEPPKPQPVQQPKPAQPLYPELKQEPSKPADAGVDWLSDIYPSNPSAQEQKPAASVSVSHEANLIDDTIRPAKPQSQPAPQPAQPQASQPPYMGQMQPGMMPAMQPGMMPGYPYSTGFQPGYPQPQMYPSGPMGQMMMMQGGMGQLSVGQQGMGPVPAVSKDLQLSSAPNLAPGGYSTNPNKEMPNFYTPHIGLIDSDAKIAKNDKFSDKPVIMAARNPFVQEKKPSDETYTADKDIKDLVDVDNLSDPFYSKPLQKKYDEQIRGVEVPNSDPHLAMKDIPVSEAGARNPFATGAQQPYMGGPMGGYPQMMYPQGQMGYPQGMMPYATGPQPPSSSNPFDLK